MRIMTSARLRAVGILLLEAAGLALLVGQRVSKDPDLKESAENLLKRARSI
jgi:hypothetical protein